VSIIEVLACSNMDCTGIGKTTLANEICAKWARDGFLAEEFDILILLPLRSIQQKSIEEMMINYIGKETYDQVMGSAGNRCLMILEGWDEIAAERREKDPFLVQVVKECTMLEKATIMITSRPHACEKLDVGRRVEIVGFGNKEILEFVEKSFPNEAKCVEQFLQKLKKYPYIQSLSYIPINLVMIVDIFKCGDKKLPSTITQLYQLFIVMSILRQVRKENERKQVSSNVILANSEDKLCTMLAGIPNEAASTLLLLCRLAYCSFFDWYSNRKDVEWLWKDPKIIFTVENLKECGLELTAEWDGYGLLKATHTHQLLTDTITYNFSHLTIQEFLCAVYIGTLSQEQQLHLLGKHFSDYPNVFIFLCGLAGSVSSEMFQFTFSNLSNYSNGVTSVKCFYESQMTCCSSQPAAPIKLDISQHSLLPYDCLCVSYVMSCCPVSELIMYECYMTDKGAEFLVEHYPSKNATSQLLEVLDFMDNDLTIDGLGHIMKIVETSELRYILRISELTTFQFVVCVCYVCCYHYR